LFSAKTAYAKGRSFEYKVKRYLENNGYLVVRSAKSAFPDLTAIRHGKVFLIECKVNGSLSWSDRIKLVNIAQATQAKCLLAYNDNGSIKFKVISR
jgi:Holliday junction resolvase